MKVRPDDLGKQVQLLSQCGGHIHCQ